MMVAGRGLLPLFLCHALCNLALALSLVSPRVEGESHHVRARRSSAYFGSLFGKNSTASVLYGDLMLEDEAEAEGGIQEKLVVRGQVVILECLERDKKHANFKGKVKETHSDAAVRWFHAEKEVKPDLRVTWSVTGRLRISHAVSGDSGVWRCRKDGFFRRPLRLIVTIPPERPFLIYGGAQLAEGARLTTRAGNALSLHCVVEGGNPAPTVEWFLNENEITANSSIRSEWRGPEAQFASVSNVTIARVLKSHHNASVVCRVVHPALSRPQTSHLKLNIEYPPDFRLRRWPVWGSPLREGSSVSLLCHVDANPPSAPSWIKEADGKEEEITSSEGWLNLTSVTPQSRGWYKCATNHPFGHFSSHSVYINVLPPRKNAKAGDDARVGASRLGVSARGHAGRKNGSVQPNSVNPLLGSPCTPSGGASSLCWHTISSPQADDESEGPMTQQYPLRQRDRLTPLEEGTLPPNCPHYLDDNSDSANKYIWKSDIKIKVMNRTHAALEGGPAMLTVHVCGSPVKDNHVTWLPPSKTTPLMPGKSFGRWTAFNLSSPDSQKCVLSNLHIVPVSSSVDAGAWIILVSNSHSVHAAIVQLNVSSAAKSLAAATADANSAAAPASAGSSHLHQRGRISSCLYCLYSLALIFALMTTVPTGNVVQ